MGVTLFGSSYASTSSMVTNPLFRFKHVFVTGATGIVGSALCETIADTGIPVTGYSRTSSGVSELSCMQHVSGDILNLEVLRNAVKDSDLIFHLAATVHNPASTIEEYESVNVMGTKNVVQIAREIGAKLIYVSTVNVEGFRKGELLDQYARTKSQAEDLVQIAIDDGLDAVIIRPSTVFGNQLGKAGLILNRVLDGSLKVLPAPSRKISPVWTYDLVTALIKAADAGEKGRTYTIAGPTMSTASFVKFVSNEVGSPVPLLSIPAWIISLPLRLAWAFKFLTRWTPPISVESLRNDSIHDGRKAAQELGFCYTEFSEIFMNSRERS